VTKNGPSCHISRFLNRQIFTTGFQQVAKIYMDSLKVLLLCLVYSQIWLDDFSQLWATS
jgi:hypothetical protein